MKFYYWLIIYILLCYEYFNSEFKGDTVTQEAINKVVNYSTLTDLYEIFNFY